jgi:hypothetical protein
MKINNKLSLWSLYLKTIKRQYIYSPTEDSEAVLVFERNNVGFKRCQVMSQQTSDSSAFLNVICHLKCVLNCERHFLYFHPD